MSTRDEFLARVRAMQPKQGDYPLPAIPVFDTPAGERLARFKSALALMGGQCVQMDDAASLRQWFGDQFTGRDSCSVVPELAGTRSLDVTHAPAALHDVDVAVVRARYGVAETGSVWLSEVEYQINAIGYLAQHLIVLLDSADIVDGIQDIYRLPDFATARYAVLVTGPSATADIEGVLIKGAQGVRALTVVLMAQLAASPATLTSASRSHTLGGSA